MSTTWYTDGNEKGLDEKNKRRKASAHIRKSFSIAPIATTFTTTTTKPIIQNTKEPEKNQNEGKSKTNQSIDIIISALNKSVTSASYATIIEVGKDVFWELFELHEDIYNGIKNEKELKDCIELILAKEDWLVEFLLSFPNVIELDYASPAYEICAERSGIELMFNNISDEEYKNKLMKNGEIEKMNEHLRIWRDNYKILEEDDIPKFLSDIHLKEKHWWWFMGDSLEK